MVVVYFDLSYFDGLYLLRICIHILIMSSGFFVLDCI